MQPPSAAWRSFGPPRPPASASWRRCELIVPAFCRRWRQAASWHRVSSTAWCSAWDRPRSHTIDASGHPHAVTEPW